MKRTHRAVLIGLATSASVAAMLLLPCASSFAATIRYVAPGGSGNGSSWSLPMGHPQVATNASSSGGEVWVAAGTYKEWGSSGSVLIMKDGVSVYGGFAGTPSTEGDFASRDPATNITVFDGDTNTSGVADDGDCDSVIWGASDTTIEGLTITHGFSLNDGGGVNLFYSPNVVVRNCIFIDNEAWSFGGGACGSGGGPLTFENCLFENNKASYGAGLSAYWGFEMVVTVDSCTFISNAASSNGGGSDFHYSTGTVRNCTYFGNTAGGLAGGAQFGISTFSITSSSFYGNSAAYGGGINGDNDNTTVTNCISWGNTAAVSGDQINLYKGSTMVVSRSCVQGGFTGLGNFDADPLFADALGGDLSILAGSPCIDAADGDAA